MRLIAASTLDDYRRSGAYLIDLRTKEEYEQGHIEGAVNIPYDFLEDYKKRLPRNRLLVLYCEWGTTSILAGRKLSQYGYDVLSVNGGCRHTVVSAICSLCSYCMINAAGKTSGLQI